VTPVIKPAKTILDSVSQIVSTRVNHYLLESPVVSEIERCNLLINENFTLICNQNIFGVEKLIRDKNLSGFLLTRFDSIKSYEKMKLTKEANKIQSTPNAGGSSEVSEALSFEMMKKYFNAQLLKCETEVSYFPEGGSITDYVIRLFDKVIGVSVTRAMKYDNSEFTTEDAIHLLSKKLKGIDQSSRNSLVEWNKQILHVWLMNEQTADSMHAAWDNLNTSLKANTVLLVTLAKNCKEIFLNPSKKNKMKRKTI
jgi:hypothetical protein